MKCNYCGTTFRFITECPKCGAPAPINKNGREEVVYTPKPIAPLPQEMGQSDDTDWGSFWGDMLRCFIEAVSRMWWFFLIVGIIVFCFMCSVPWMSYVGR
jgi:hypothetical protein